MQATPHCALFVMSGEDSNIEKCRALQVDFQVTCPAGRVVVETIFEACMKMHFLLKTETIM